MVGEALERKVTEFTTRHNIRFKKYNERQWGSYEPIFSLDGANWFHPGQLFGWGWSESQVTAETFDRIIGEKILNQWLGDARYAELLFIINDERTRLAKEAADDNQRPPEIHSGSLG